MRCKSGGECSTRSGIITGAATVTRGAAKQSLARTTSGRSALNSTKPCRSSAIRLHSLRGAFLPDFEVWQWPLWQQSFLTPGTMKNCGQETQPPHRRVTVVSPQSSEVRKERSTAPLLCYLPASRICAGLSKRPSTSASDSRSPPWIVVKGRSLPGGPTNSKWPFVCCTRTRHRIASCKRISTRLASFFQDAEIRPVNTTNAPPARPVQASGDSALARMASFFQSRERIASTPQRRHSAKPPTRRAAPNPFIPNHFPQAGFVFSNRRRTTEVDKKCATGGILRLGPSSRCYPAKTCFI